MVTEAEAHDLIMALPGVEESTSYGHHAYKVKGKFFTRVRAQDESDPGVLVLKSGFFERDALMSMQPETFFVAPHYQNYPTVLVRLDQVERDQLTDLLTESWRHTAPKRMVAAYDADHPGASP